LSNGLEGGLLLVDVGLIGAEEDVTDGVLALAGEGDVEARGLLDHEGVGHTGHDTGTITIAGVGRGGTTMSLCIIKKSKGENFLVRWMDFGVFDLTRQ
jgi:hypothetical protein